MEKEDGGMYHLDINPVEFTDEGDWKCIVINDFGHSVTSCSLQLTIPRYYRKPHFLEPLRAVLSEEGTVNLECKVIGVPQPVLQWFKDGSELKPGDIHRIMSGQDGTCCLGTYTCQARNCMGSSSSSASLLSFEEARLAKEEPIATHSFMEHAAKIARNPSLSTIQEERSSQMSLYETASAADSLTGEERAEISVSIDGRAVSLSLYDTPDLTEDDAQKIVELFAEELSERISYRNTTELPPLRFTRATATSGSLLMEAVVIDVPLEVAQQQETLTDISCEEAPTEVDIEELSAMEALIIDENNPQDGYLDDVVIPDLPYEALDARRSFSGLNDICVMQQPVVDTINRESFDGEATPRQRSVEIIDSEDESEESVLFIGQSDDVAIDSPSVEHAGSDFFSAQEYSDTCSAPDIDSLTSPMPDSASMADVEEIQVESSEHLETAIYQTYEGSEQNVHDYVSLPRINQSMESENESPVSKEGIEMGASASGISMLDLQAHINLGESGSQESEIESWIQHAATGNLASKEGKYGVKQSTSESPKEVSLATNITSLSPSEDKFQSAQSLDKTTSLTEYHSMETGTHSLLSVSEENSKSTKQLESSQDIMQINAVSSASEESANLRSKAILIETAHTINPEEEKESLDSTNELNSLSKAKSETTITGHLREAVPEAISDVHENKELTLVKEDEVKERKEEKLQMEEEEQLRKKADEELKRMMEDEELKRKAEEGELKRKKEEEKKKMEEERKRKEELKRKTEEEELKRKKEEEQRKMEEEQKKMEEEQKKMEEERKRKEEEELKRKAEEEEIKRKKEEGQKEEEERKRKEEELKRKTEEEELKRMKEEELKKKEEERKRKEEEELKRKAEEEELKRKKEEELKKKEKERKRKEEEELKRKAEEEELKRKKQEELKKMEEEEELKRKAEEKELNRKKEEELKKMEEERKRKEVEELKRKTEEEELKRKKEEELKKKEEERKCKEEEELKRKAEEEELKRKKAEAELARKNEEEELKFRKEEEERKRKTDGEEVKRKKEEELKSEEEESKRKVEDLKHIQECRDLKFKIELEEQKRENEERLNRNEQELKHFGTRGVSKTEVGMRKEMDDHVKDEIDRKHKPEEEYQYLRYQTDVKDDKDRKNYADDTSKMSYRSNQSATAIESKGSEQMETQTDTKSSSDQDMISYRTPGGRFYMVERSKGYNEKNVDDLLEKVKQLKIKCGLQVAEEKDSQNLELATKSTRDPSDYQFKRENESMPRTLDNVAVDAQEVSKQTDKSESEFQEKQVDTKEATSSKNQVEGLYSSIKTRSLRDVESKGIGNEQKRKEEEENDKVQKQMKQLEAQEQKPSEEAKNIFDTKNEEQNIRRKEYSLEKEQVKLEEEEKKKSKNEEQILTEAEILKEEKKRREKDEKLKEAEKKRKEEEHKLIETQKKKKEEEKCKEEEEKKRKEEEERKRKEEEEEKRKEEANKLKEAEKKRKEEEEKKRKEEENKLKEAEKKRKEEEEKKRKEDQEEKKRVEEQTSLGKTEAKGIYDIIFSSNLNTISLRKLHFSSIA